MPAATRSGKLGAVSEADGGADGSGARRPPIATQIAAGTLLGVLAVAAISLSCSGTGRPDAASLSASVDASLTKAISDAQSPPDGKEGAQPLLGAPQAKVDSVDCTEPKGGTSSCTATLTLTPLNPTAKPFPRKQTTEISVGTNGCWRTVGSVEIPGPYGGPKSLSGCVED